MIKIKEVTLELPITLVEDDIEFVKDMHEKWDGYAEGCPFKDFFEQTDMEKAMRMLINITTPIKRNAMNIYDRQDIYNTKLQPEYRLKLALRFIKELRGYENNPCGEIEIGTYERCSVRAPFVADPKLVSFKYIQLATLKPLMLMKLIYDGKPTNINKAIDVYSDISEEARILIKVYERVMNE